MIDIHAHILPEVDDGSDSLETSLEMANMAVMSGVTAVVATPHCNIPDDECIQDAEEMRYAVRAFRKELEDHQIPLRIYEGMEIFGAENTVERFRRQELATLNRSVYPLVEFPFMYYAGEATGLLRSLISLGLRPIVAHPERYDYIQEDPALLNIWFSMGCYLQVNRGSLTGRFGEQIEDLSLAMLDRGFVSFIASDAHSSEFRTTWMRDVKELTEDMMGEDYAHRLLFDNPSHMLRNLIIEREDPIWF